MPHIQWEYSNGSVVEGGSNFSLSNMMTSGNTTTRNLTFTPLRTSHGEEYTCRAIINIPSISVSGLNNSESSKVTVQSKLLAVFTVLNSSLFQLQEKFFFPSKKSYLYILSTFYTLHLQSTELYSYFRMVHAGRNPANTLSPSCYTIIQILYLLPLQDEILVWCSQTQSHHAPS